MKFDPPIQLTELWNMWRQGQAELSRVDRPAPRTLPRVLALTDMRPDAPASRPPSQQAQSVGRSLSRYPRGAAWADMADGRQQPGDARGTSPEDWRIPRQPSHPPPGGMGGLL